MIHLIAGPTASGKSALALRLAEEIGGEIVNADSMQLYRDLRILTARPGSEDESRVPHHLYGVADAAEAWSVGRWLKAAILAVAEITARKKPAVIVGGTGLYFRALTQGLAEIPPVPASVRSEALHAYATLGEAEFRRQLAKADPVAARRIAAGDRQRLTRAMEVFMASGRPLSDLQVDNRSALPPGSWQGQIVDLARDQLVARCEARLTNMVTDGVLEEIAAIVARNLPRHLPAMKALGLAPFAAHLNGELSLSAALNQANIDTRRYAKRQATWFRHQTPDWPRTQL